MSHIGDVSVMTGCKGSDQYRDQAGSKTFRLGGSAAIWTVVAASGCGNGRRNHRRNFPGRPNGCSAAVTPSANSARGAAAFAGMTAYCRSQQRGRQPHLRRPT